MVLLNMHYNVFKPWLRDRLVSVCDECSIYVRFYFKAKNDINSEMREE